MKKELSQIIKTAYENKATLLGVGAMSKEEVYAALDLCKELQFPLMFIASRNQVDMELCGRGYANNWNSAEFSDCVKNKAEELGISDYVYLCRDHGGPWQRDDEFKKKVELEKAMELCLQSFYEDLDAGFTLIHIDTSKDWKYEGKIPLPIAVERTVYLLDKLETYRKNHNLEPVVYEISLEETGRESCEVEEFTEYVEQMVSEFKKNNLIIPEFIVGDTGTFVRMDRNIGEFRVSNVEKLSKVAAENEMYLKEHNADYIDIEILKKHPEMNIAMANVAPEFARAESVALLELVEKVNKALEDGSKTLERKSLLGDIIRERVLQSPKWRKWIDDELDADKAILDESFQKRAIQVCAHYFFSDEEVQKERSILYDNVIELNLVDDPGAYVRNSIKESIKRYVLALNLRDFNQYIK